MRVATSSTASKANAIFAATSASSLGTLSANHISEQDPLPTLEALQVHLFERKEISWRRMHADAW
jgi:hypothetical protein